MYKNSTVLSITDGENGDSYLVETIINTAAYGKFKHLFSTNKKKPWSWSEIVFNVNIILISMVPNTKHMLNTKICILVLLFKYLKYDLGQEGIVWSISRVWWDKLLHAYWLVFRKSRSSNLNTCLEVKLFAWPNTDAVPFKHFVVKCCCSVVHKLYKKLRKEFKSEKMS